MPVTVASRKLTPRSIAASVFCTASDLLLCVWMPMAPFQPAASASTTRATSAPSIEPKESAK